MALSANRDTKKYGSYPIAEEIVLDVAASTTIYKGSMVARDASGNAVPASAAQGLRILGRAEEKVDNSAGIAGAKTVKIRKGVYSFANGATTDALTKADIGRKIYASDDQTLARTSSKGNRPVAGIMVGLESSSKIFVELGGPDPEPGDLHILAGADLSSSQYFFVKLDTATAAVVAGAGENAIGVLQNAPASGAVAIIRTQGLSKVIAGDAVVIGVAVASNAAGKAVTATLARTKTDDAGAAVDPLLGSNVMGDAWETGVADASMTIFIQRRGSAPTTPS
jgi:hypothetical protein